MSFQEFTISFWLSLILWSYANICASLIVCGNLKSSKIKISQQQFEYSLHLNNETRGHCAVFAQNDFWGQYLPNTFSNLKFIYSEKPTQFCEISIVDLSYVVTVKSTVEISQNFVAFSEYMNFKFEKEIGRYWHQNSFCA